MCNEGSLPWDTVQDRGYGDSGSARTLFTFSNISLLQELVCKFQPAVCIILTSFKVMLNSLTKWLLSASFHVSFIGVGQSRLWCQRGTINFNRAQSDRFVQQSVRHAGRNAARQAVKADHTVQRKSLHRSCKIVRWLPMTCKCQHVKEMWLKTHR